MVSVTSSVPVTCENRFFNTIEVWSMFSKMSFGPQESQKKLPICFLFLEPVCFAAKRISKSQKEYAETTAPEKYPTLCVSKVHQCISGNSRIKLTRANITRLNLIKIG